MTSETPNLHVSKNPNISKTKQDIEKLKTPLRLVWKCCSVVFKIGSKIFSLQWHSKPRSISMKSRRHKHIQILSTSLHGNAWALKLKEISRPQHLQKPVSSLKNFRNGLISYTD